MAEVDPELPLIPTEKGLISSLRRESGLLVSSQPKGVRTVVVSARGDGVQEAYRAGTAVVLKAGAGVEVQQGDDMYLVFAESDILAIVRARD